MSGWIAAALSAALIPTAAAQPTPEPHQLPNNPDDYYAAAVDFAKCSANWQFASETATLHNLKETATAFGDTARGWRVAGMFFLVESMAPQAQPRAGETFDFLVSAHLQTLRANRELYGDRADQEAIEEIKRVCTPWSETQEAIIGAMRRSLPATPEDQ